MRSALGLFIFLVSGNVIGQETSRDANPPLTLLEAVRATLAHDSVIQLQNQEVNASRGRLQTASGQFDSVFAASVAHTIDTRAVPSSETPNVFSRVTLNETAYRVSLNKQLRSGIVLSPGVEMSRVDDNFSTPDALNRGSVGFLLRIPLLRGLGEKATAAAERAARIEMEATRLSLRHVVSQEVLNTALAYWNYVAAQRRLEIIRESEVRAERLVAQVQALVQADEQPRTELQKLTANLANSTATRVSAEQALVEARQQLGLAIGLPFEQMLALPPPVDAFPGVQPENLIEPKTGVELTTFAIERRADLSAAAQLERAAETLLAGARNNLKPQLDLNLKAGYAGASSGVKFKQYFTPFAENVEGLNAFAALNFEFPPANNAARGVLVQREALYQQSKIRRDELTRVIRSDVFVATERLRTGVQELIKTEESTGLYQTAVANEKTKLNLGMATILDVLQLEDRLTSALVNHLLAQLRYAAAIARLRFETGTLVRTDGGRESVTLDRLITIPSNADSGK